MRERRQWKDMSTAQRVQAISLGVLQIGLLVAAQRDIARRSAAHIRGDKRMWRAIALVNYLGPIAYFCLGIARPTPADS